ncbi:hypothetical protein [Streptomyces geranii]|uniref:hypothetical protein n=1 Tax=Streptomyces geranii TaxID=2058923 RepID=UPI000D02C856|nr:hypothetical protein [Streptomyces geranii]
MDEANEPTERERPPALAPADEAMLARAQTLREITDAALLAVGQPYPGDDHGSLLRDALFVQGLAERLIDQAVVAERERGASWTDIGSAVGSSRQSAHERWNTRVGAWVLLGRQRNGIGHGPADPADHVRNLDEWYAELTPDEPHAISTQLSSLHDEAARTEANSRRAEAKQLHARAEELRKEIDAASNDAMGATGTAREEKRAVWAAKHFARAEVYDRLADLEEPLAAEHRRRAATQRGIAQDILRGRSAESLPAEGGTRERVYAAYLDLTDQERSGSKRAVAALLAERLDSPGADSIRKHLDHAIEAYRAKQRAAFVLDIAACSDPDIALSTATSLLQDYAPNTEFWQSLSHRLLSRYLMAAALDGADVGTLYTWVCRPDERRPVELLRSGPVPEWADECEEILSSHRKTSSNVLLVLQAVLRTRVPDVQEGGEQ